ncbi:MAG: hypothetical protein DSY46_03190 [Hydrogenimonas sp.]|nr:MAG: hypothetical protein DSY46_03190 [Hydrogenimonas sp.]
MPLFYIRNEDIITIESPEDAVIISPSLYWYEYVEFPTKSLSKAKRLADTFLASRPSSYTKIYVERHGQGFDCYAYDPERLKVQIDKISAKHLPRYFLQQLADQLPVRIDALSIAEMINGIAVEIANPKEQLRSIDTIDFSTLPKPFNRHRQGTLPKYLGITLIGVFLLSMGVDLTLRYQALQATQTMVEQTRTNRSFYEIKSLLKRFENRQTKQEKLRTAIQQALQHRLKDHLTCSIQSGCTYE